MISADCRSSSTNTTGDAPGLSVSIPKAPLPTKRSRTLTLITASHKLETMAALTRTNPVVDRKLGIEFQPAVECDCAGRSQANIRRAQNQIVNRDQPWAQMIFRLGLL